METNKFELTDEIKDITKSKKAIDKSLFFDEDDDDYNSRFDDEEFMVGTY